MRWAVGIMERLGYPGVILIVALENIFPPIPSEVVLPFAGFLTRRGYLTLPGVVLAATFGSLLGALTLYCLGRIVGRQRLFRLTKLPYAPISEAGLRRAARWFARYGPWTVFFGRMVPAVRSLISIPAGLARMPLAVFTLYTAAGTAIWNTALACLGATLGAAWPEAGRWLSYYEDLILLLVLAGLAVFLLVRTSRRRQLR